MAIINTENRFTHMTITTVSTNMPKTNPKRTAREKFRKRKANCLKKAHELGQLCQAEVYILIYHNDKYYTYNSTTVATTRFRNCKGLSIKVLDSHADAR